MRTALITGASSGFGQVFARRLAARGTALILTARREEPMHALAAELKVPVRIIPADLATDEGIAAIAAVIRETETLDLLINNAGFGSKRRFWEADYAQQEAMHRVHVLATLQLTRAAIEGMVRRNSGAVIHVSSVAAFAQSQGAVSYCATKAWMNVFTEGLAMELRGIRSAVQVQALCPGYTHTGFHDALGVDKSVIPKWLWLDADDVVDDSLRGLDNRQVIVIPNWKYKLAVLVMRHLPLSIRLRLGRPGKDRRT